MSGIEGRKNYHEFGLVSTDYALADLLEIWLTDEHCFDSREHWEGGIKRPCTYDDLFVLAHKLGGETLHDLASEMSQIAIVHMGVICNEVNFCPCCMMKKMFLLGMSFGDLSCSKELAENWARQFKDHGIPHSTTEEFMRCLSLWRNSFLRDWPFRHVYRIAEDTDEAT